MKKRNQQSNEWASGTRKKTIKLAIWTTAWVLTVAVAAFGPELVWKSNTVINTIVILLNVGVGVGMIIANIKHLKSLDELMQKVHLEAMGISLGVAVVGGIAYSLVDATNVISSDAEIGGLIIMIALSYLLAVLINMRRYK